MHKNSEQQHFQYRGAFPRICKRRKQKTLRDDAQFAEKNLIASQYRERARSLQEKVFVLVPERNRKQKQAMSCHLGVLKVSNISANAC